MAYVKVFADKQTETRTNRGEKNYMAPNYRCGSIKNAKVCLDSFQKTCGLLDYKLLYASAN